jgi:MFS family permease
LLTLAAYGGAAVSLAAFVLRQAHAKAPLIEPTFYRKTAIAAALASSAMSGATLVVAMVSVPLFTNAVLGGSAIEGGLNLIRLTIALPIGALAGGWVTTRYGRLAAALPGFALAASGFALMSTWDSDPSFIEMTLPLFVAGLGFGLVIAPINSAVMDEANEDERATAASLITATRLLGALVGVALLTTRGLGSFYTEAGLVPLDDPQFLDRLRDLEVNTFSETFLVTAAVCALSLVPALMLGRGRKPE